MSAKLKLLEKKLGLVPKTYPPMSQGMERLARQTERHAPVPDQAPSDLGEALDALIQQRVDEALAVERERHAIQLQQLREQINRQAVNQPAKKPPPAFETVWHRDGAGKLLWAETTVESDGRRFISKVERDAAGAVVRMHTAPTGESPVLPALDVPYKVEARQYQPGTPRKLYGNDQEA